MDTKIIKDIKTSCPFPLLQFDCSVSFNEVTKASGIAYILLELLSKSVMTQDRIADVLLKFGIPQDTHYLFAREMRSLVQNDIVESVVNAEAVSDIKYFSEMRLADFSITNKGQLMFSEGAIPTGEAKQKAAKVFYSPVFRSFSLECKQSISPIATSFLGESFMENVEVDVSDIEEYIKSVQTRVGLKKEEVIFKEEHEDPKVYAAKTDDNLTIRIGESGISFVFGTSDEKAFFEQYFSASLMSEGMLRKDKYKFSILVPTVSYHDIKARNLYIPDDSKKQASRPCKMYLGRDRLGLVRTDNVIQLADSTRFLDLLDSNAEFALLDSAGCRYYSPLNIQFACDCFEDAFQMEMLVETEAEPDIFAKLISEIFANTVSKDFTPDTGRIIAYVSSVQSQENYLRKYAENKIGEKSNAEERLELLMKLNTAFDKVEGWGEIFKKLSESEFKNYVSGVTIENAIFKNTMLTPLKTAMGMNALDYMLSFAQNLQKEEPEVAFQALTACNFNTKQVLSVVNVIPVFMANVLDGSYIDSPTELGQKYQLVNSNLSELCNLLGIDNPYEYSIRDDYNIDDFFRANATFVSAVKAIEEYRNYDKEDYAVLDQYCKIIHEEQDKLSIERTASEHPDKVTKQFIEWLISKGRYNEAISTLFVKLQYDLRVSLEAESFETAYDLINKAKERKLISADEMNILHKFRLCRDAIQHPEKKQIKYSDEDLKVFTNVTFRLKGDKR